MWKLRTTNNNNRTDLFRFHSVAKKARCLVDGLYQCRPETELGFVLDKEPSQPNETLARLILSYGFEVPPVVRHCVVE